MLAHRTILKSAGEIITSVSIVGGALLWTWNAIGKPKAQEFITSTVNERLSTLEATQQAIVAEQRSISESLEAIVKKQTTEARQSVGEADTNKEILCRLKALTGEGVPQDCQ